MSPLQAFLVSDWKFHPESRGSHVEIGEQFQKKQGGPVGSGIKKLNQRFPQD